MERRRFTHASPAAPSQCMQWLSICIRHVLSDCGECVQSSAGSMATAGSPTRICIGWQIALVRCCCVVDDEPPDQATVEVSAGKFLAGSEHSAFSGFPDDVVARPSFQLFVGVIPAVKRPDVLQCVRGADVLENEARRPMRSFTLVMGTFLIDARAQCGNVPPGRDGANQHLRTFQHTITSLAMKRPVCDCPDEEVLPKGREKATELRSSRVLGATQK